MTPHTAPLLHVASRITVFNDRISRWRQLLEARRQLANVRSVDNQRTMEIPMTESSASGVEKNDMETADRPSYRVVAFLQNCWFRPGTSHRMIDLYLTDQSFRRKVLAMSMTGRRLKTAFADKFPDIWWDNASQFVADYSSGCNTADPIHMEAVLQQIKPVGIVTFGRIANEGMLNIARTQWPIPKWHYFPHPNARGLTQAQINEFAAEILSRYF